MIKTEVIEFLDKKKVYVKDKSNEIQEKLFSLGFKWYSSGEKKYSHPEEPFIFIDSNDMSISYCRNVDYFNANHSEEITVNDILDITIDPFKIGDILSSKEKGTLIIYGGCNKSGEVKYYVFINEYYTILENTPTGSVGHVNDFKLANDSEVYQMINILKKYGQKWNNTLKCLEKIEYVFKTFDQVLVRDKNDDIWRPAHFKDYSKGSEFPYGIISNMFSYKQCIPFKGNEHLCGTSNK